MSYKPLLVVDTNVFINAYWPEIGKNMSCDEEITRLVKDGKVHLGMSNATADELAIIASSAISLAQESDSFELYMIIADFMRRARPYWIPKPVPRREISIHDDNDLKFLFLAIQLGADYLITNDKESGLLDLSIEETNQVKVVQPLRFVRDYTTNQLHRNPNKIEKVDKK
ncbi:PIN domain-containing protein [Brevibacillus sp. H7]|uniref:PIN domain-containing protein n=1 Tax=Brevibacillus sp. H7 TaxID=3349138 RepID=UPI0037F48DCE